MKDTGEYVKEKASDLNKVSKKWIRRCKKLKTVPSKNVIRPRNTWVTRLKKQSNVLKKE